MKLVSARVENFRSVDDSGEFSINDMTCLVGKNEAGKTAVLQALEGLRPSDGNDQYDKLRDYPRRYLNEYDARHDGGDAKVITTKWELSADDIVEVEKEFGKGCLPNPIVEVAKLYETARTTWTTGFDEQKAVSHLVDSCNFNAAEAKVVEACSTASEIINQLEGRDGNTDKHQTLLARISAYRRADPALHVIDLLSARMPTFMYFSHYDRMSGKISVNQLEADQASKETSEGDEVFLDFLEFAGTSLDEIKSFEESEDLIAKVEAASNTITDKIFEYWSQNTSLSVEFKIDNGKAKDPAPFNKGVVMEARVRNNIHRMTVPFSERSAGFIWFFSFLIRFSKVTNENDNVILLLDEPGLTLHATAQADLLRFFKEKIVPNHQIIFTTHSPFMIPPDDLSCVRTVEDIVEQVGPMKYDSHGTKVGDDVLSTDKDTLFPLQGALGYEITQALFIGENTLLVEGPSDLLYLQAVSEVLRRRGKVGLDPRWTICPTGGMDKVSAFVSLFGGNKLNVAVLTDFATGQKGKVERLKSSGLLKEGHILTINEFCEQDEADIEDMFEPPLYCHIVNEAYDLAPEHQLDERKLMEADDGMRLVKKAESYFRVLPPEIPEFDHFAPSAWLVGNMDYLNSENDGTEATLVRFEELFRSVNDLLD